MDSQHGSQQSITKEKGQILVLVAIMLVAMMAMLALVLDGGTAYTKRREAQNAADAGALAGARVFCETKDASDAIAAGVLYATDRNGATSATAQAAGSVVTVTAQITTPTYFAHLIGIPEVGVQAVAAAGCEVPSTGKSILPVAWACQRPPITGTSPITGTECLDEDSIITQDELNIRLAQPRPTSTTIWPELFILMDSSWLEDDMTYVCAPPHGSTDTIRYPGELDCDLDNDGDNDMAANGDRSWLDLNGGGGGTNELKDWISNGFPAEIDIHSWIGGERGSVAALYRDVHDVRDRIFAVPIFDRLCTTYPGVAPCLGTDSHGQQIWHTGDTVIATSGDNYYYHVAGFGAFYVTCVTAPGITSDCPGHNYTVEQCTFGKLNPQGACTGDSAGPPKIEGYFVYGVFSNLGSVPSENPLDSGAYTIRLYK